MNRRLGGVIALFAHAGRLAPSRGNCNIANICRERRAHFRYLTHAPGVWYDSVFFHPPYQTCTTGDNDPAESAEIDSDSVVVELFNTWTSPPAGQAALFSQGESDLTSRFGAPRRCNATTQS